jgi:hypothetical protein
MQERSFMNFPQMGTGTKFNLFQVEALIESVVFNDLDLIGYNHRDDRAPPECSTWNHRE